MDYSYRGKHTSIFEQKLCDYTKSKYCLATNSGTSALHLAYMMTIGKNEEVFVPALTYVGTVNPLTYIGAVPHFVDSDEYYGIDVNRLEDYIQTLEFKDRLINPKTKRKITAIVPVHLYGMPCDMDGILRIANKYNLTVIEDAAGALGSYYKDNHCGTMGDIGIISFNGNKIITTGGGGCFITNNKIYYERALYLSQVSKDYPKNYHSEVGYNYRMPAYNAIKGIKELKKLKIKKKEIIFKDRPYTKPNHWKVPTYEKTDLPFYPLVSSFPMYKKCPKMDLYQAEEYTKLYLR